nr:hypothetical protein [uncultured Emticicia sp.]
MISVDKIDKVNAATKHIFKVPHNYFENLTTSILNKTTESTINHSSKTQESFSIPDNYFEGLSSTIINRIEQIEKEYIDLEHLERVNILSVPENYFQALEINTNIERYGKNNVFKVPNGYFDVLKNNILSNITPKSTKIIKVNWWKSPTTKLSAAACVILIVGLWFGIPQVTKDKTAVALEKVSSAEIKTYLETQDLSYLEYESATEITQNTTKEVLDGLNIDKKDILEHLENQDLEEDI